MTEKEIEATSAVYNHGGVSLLFCLIRYIIVYQRCETLSWDVIKGFM
ncbi:hypothetical protein [Sporolactobacillus spathodeae]|uniref:Uncharacterized protein n=1 Tax=Sporolactobacillus spathodeae TaxID=1465502 RepID=A0ABS2Q4T3_9BACL|nr:hypothetical protein [Sporolactobacillus spathodeae]MBM7656743.1 hypothetical protein [Sporolactobacillus spathodeae]